MRDCPANRRTTRICQMAGRRTIATTFTKTRLRLQPSGSNHIEEGFRAEVGRLLMRIDSKTAIDATFLSVPATTEMPGATACRRCSASASSRRHDQAHSYELHCPN